MYAGRGAKGKISLNVCVREREREDVGTCDPAPRFFFLIHHSTPSRVSEMETWDMDRKHGLLGGMVRGGGRGSQNGYVCI